MNVILLEKIYKLGNIGDEVKVKSGYARNFLIPSGKALYSTPENKEFFKEKSDSIKAENEKTKKDALKIFELLSDKEVILIRAASESGQLFGSVSTKDIIKYLNDEGFNLSKNQVDLNKSIKNLTYENVRIILHPEVSCKIILNVARSKEEASKQKELGKAISNNEILETNKEDVSNEKTENLQPDKKTTQESSVSEKNEHEITDQHGISKISENEKKNTETSK